MRTIRSQMTFLIYKSLLLEFGHEGVKEVFNSETLDIAGKAIPTAQFLEELVDNPQTLMPLEQLISIFEKTENFLYKKHFSLDKFISDLLIVQSKAYAISSVHDMLLMMEPLLHEAYTEENLYKFAFKLIQTVHQTQIKGSSFKLIGHTIKGNKGRGIMHLLYDKENPGAYAYDLTIWKSFIVKAAPLMISIPPFDKVFISAECRKIGNILSDIDYKIIEEELFIDGKRYGKQMLYSDFLHKDPLYKDAFCPIGWKGFYIDKDLYSEEKGRTVLRAGCFYNAPAALIEYFYTKQKHNTKDILKNITSAIHDSMIGKSVTDGKFIEKHEQLTKQEQKTVKITYNQNQHKLSIDNTFFARSFPAQLLYFLCKNYCETQKTKYCYQDIISSSIFSIDPIKPNLNIRISRLQEKLINQREDISIVTTARGEFKFICNSSIELEVIK